MARKRKDPKRVAAGLKARIEVLKQDLARLRKKREQRRYHDYRLWFDDFDIGQVLKEKESIEQRLEELRDAELEGDW